ncbi:NADAR family protein [Robiginitalea aurantiaca]|nr:NADAR family protein [Robiginitalea aurantiaca]
MEYNLNEVVWFQKTDTEYGGLSNMKGKIFPMNVNGHLFHTSEALYQACRFPDYPEIQREIMGHPSPMTAKMKSKKYRNTHTRNDFEEVKEDIMWWCLRVKMAHHPVAMGALLRRSGSKPIVEVSHKDRFWGTVRSKENENLVVGDNVLGKLLIRLRAYYFQNQGSSKLLRVPPLEISNFKLLGQPIEEVDCFRGLRRE